MNKKTIDNIAWWIPIRKLRDYFRNKMYSKIIDKCITEYNDKVKEIYNNRKIILVQMETHNRCNNDCNFCPVSVGNDIRKYHKMSDELFIKIINDLSDINYKGMISLFDNNEPFLDKRILNFFKIAKEKLPYAFHYIMTNGLTVTLEDYIESCKYLDMFLIDNYNNNGELNPNTKIIYDFCINNPQYNKKTVILMRSKNEILTSRAGNSPNRKNSLKRIPYLCTLPLWQFHIRPDGKVSLCCCDAYGQMTLGDLTKNTVKEIWNSKLFNRLQKLLLKGRNSINICKYCDYVDDIERTYKKCVQNEYVYDTLELFKNWPHSILKQ